MRIPPGRLKDVVEIAATRNVVVHNRSRIDERYLRAVPTSGAKAGELRELTVDYLFEAKELLFTIVAQTDEAVACKYGLPSIAIAGAIDQESAETPNEVN